MAAVGRYLCIHGKHAVSIYPLFRGLPFDPDHIALMSSVFESVSRELGLAERVDQFRDMIAQAIVECAQKGIRDPAEMRKCAHSLLQDA